MKVESPLPFYNQRSYMGVWGGFTNQGNPGGIGNKQKKKKKEKGKKEELHRTQLVCPSNQL
jgi:hypothetical protein